LAQQEEHELVACIHLARPNATDDDDGEESYMYQSAGSEVVEIQVTQCLGVPLISHTRTGTSKNTSLVYNKNNIAAGDKDDDDENNRDEVEDLYRALVQAKQQFPEIAAVSSGAILSTYQRVRIENVCGRLGLQSLAYLWRCDNQKNLLSRMIHLHGIHSVLVKTAAPPGLIPKRHLNQSVQQLYSHFCTLHERYQFHICGEGGEYETLVLDCPIFRKRLVFDQTEIVEDESDGGETGYLRILACHAEPKEDFLVPDSLQVEEPIEFLPNPSSMISKDDSYLNKQVNVSTFPAPSFAPRIRLVSGGLWSVSEIQSPLPGHLGGSSTTTSFTEAAYAVAEALEILSILERTLERVSCLATDVIMVHLYLSEISHFANINEHYRKFFGIELPPSRSTVAVGKNALPGGRRVLLDCLVQCGSGEYLRSHSLLLNASSKSMDDLNPYARAAIQSNANTKLREVLHVQSISHWAPVCVGPYSQVNTIRGSLHFCAGQIGLVPGSMKLRKTWMEQLEQCWSNLARVLDALDGASISELLSCLLFVADNVFFEQGALPKISTICDLQMRKNGNLCPGTLDGTPRFDVEINGSEDDVDVLEARNYIFDGEHLCPILIVSIPQMPVGALTEIEAVAATRRAATSLKITNQSARTSCDASTHASIEIDPCGWDCGNDFDLEQRISIPVEIEAHLRFLGSLSAASALVMSTFKNQNDIKSELYVEPVLHAMLRLLREEPMFEFKNVLQFRLYYIGAAVDASEAAGLQASPIDDGTTLRSAFHSALGSFYEDASRPTFTVIPVRGMCRLNVSRGRGEANHSIVAPFMSLQAISIDPVRLETNIWIHNR
jgi:diphthine-ammonia ligase